MIPVPTEVTVAVITVAGVGFSALLGRRRKAESNASVELTEAQAADVVTNAAQQVVAMMSEERKHMAERLIALENEVTALRIRVATLEQREQELLAQARSLRAELAQAHTDLARAHAELQMARELLAARESELRVARVQVEQLQSLAVTPPPVVS
jgi:chromosome segregation ATPase